MGLCCVAVLSWADSCTEFRWGIDGGLMGSSNGELGSDTKSAMELLVEGVEVPKDAVLDEGIIVAAQSRGMNLLLTLG